MLQVEAPEYIGKQAWREDSACKDVASRMFFDEALAAQAKQVCAVCPVRTQCRISADAAGEALGVWGGLSGSERGWSADGTRIVGEAERMIFVCLCCDAAVSWPMSPSPVETQLGQGRWRIEDDAGAARFLISRTDGRDVQRGHGVSCRNGHEVGLSTDFSGVIALANDAVRQVSMRQRRRPRQVA